MQLGLSFVRRVAGGEGARRGGRAPSPARTAPGAGDGETREGWPVREQPRSGGACRRARVRALPGDQARRPAGDVDDVGLRAAGRRSTPAASACDEAFFCLGSAEAVTTARRGAAGPTRADARSSGAPPRATSASASSGRRTGGTTPERVRRQSRGLWDGHRVEREHPARRRAATPPAPREACRRAVSRRRRRCRRCRGPRGRGARRSRRRARRRGPSRRARGHGAPWVEHGTYWAAVAAITGAVSTPPTVAAQRPTARRTAPRRPASSPTREDEGDRVLSEPRQRLGPTVACATRRRERARRGRVRECPRARRGVVR